MLFRRQILVPKDDDRKMLEGFHDLGENVRRQRLAQIDARDFATAGATDRFNANQLEGIGWQPRHNRGRKRSLRCRNC